MSTSPAKKRTRLLDLSTINIIPSSSLSTNHYDQRQYQCIHKCVHTELHIVSLIVTQVADQTCDNNACGKRGKTLIQLTSFGLW